MFLFPLLGFLSESLHIWCFIFSFSLNLIPFLWKMSNVVWASVFFWISFGSYRRFSPSVFLTRFYSLTLASVWTKRVCCPISPDSPQASVQHPSYQLSLCLLALGDWVPYHEDVHVILWLGYSQIKIGRLILFKWDDQIDDALLRLLCGLVLWAWNFSECFLAMSVAFEPQIWLLIYGKFNKWRVYFGWKRLILWFEPGNLVFKQRFLVSVALHCCRVCVWYANYSVVIAYQVLMPMQKDSNDMTWAVPGDCQFAL